MRRLRPRAPIGFCFGGRKSFLSATIPDLRLAGVIGFYGWPVGASRNDTPAPADIAASFRAPVPGLFGGADRGIPASAAAWAEVREFLAAHAASGGGAA